VLVCLSLIAPAAPARATVRRARRPRELARDAIAIARGGRGGDAQWTDDRADRNDRHARRESLTSRVLRIGARSSAGGELGRFRSIVVGAPEFVVDHGRSWFPRPLARGEHLIVGFNQAVCRVVAASRAGS